MFLLNFIFFPITTPVITAEISTVETSPVKTSLAKKTLVETLAAKTSTAETSSTEKTTAKTSTVKTSPVKTSPVKTSVAEKTFAKTLAAKTSTAETSSTEKTTAETSTVETSPVKTSVAEKTFAKTSTAETSTAEISTAETSSAEKTFAETLAAKISVAKTSTVACEKNILMLYSYSINFAPDAQILHAFSSVVNTSHIPLRVKHIEMNTFLPKDAVADVLDHKYAAMLEEINSNRYDIIVVFGQPAIDFLTRNVDFIPEQTGITYCGLRIDGRELQKKHSRTAGIVGDIPVIHTLNLAIQLFPHTKNVVVLSNWSPAGQRVCNDARQLMARHPELNIVIPANTDFSLTELFSLISGLGDNTVVLFYSWFNLDTTNLISLDYIFKQLEYRQITVFAMQMPMMEESKVVGGVYSPVSEMGKRLGEQTLDFLKEKTDIPSTSVPLETGINYDAIKSRKISRRLIPRDAVILGQPLIRYTIVHHWLFPWFVLFFFLLFLSLLMAFLGKKWKLDKTNQLNRQLTELKTEYELMLNTLPLYIYIKDANNGFQHIRANNKCGELWKRSIDDILGKSDEDLFDNPNEVRLFHETDLATMETDSIREDILPFTGNEGTPRIGKFYRKRLCFEDGRRWLVGIVLDITEDEQHKTQLQTTQALCEQVINAIPSYFFTKDADNSFRYKLCNQEFANFVGKTVEEIIGKTDSELFSQPEEAQHYLEDDIKAMASPDSISIQEISTDCKGINHHISMVKKAFIDLHKKRFLIGCGSDITELTDMIRNEQINSEVLAHIITEPLFSRTVDKIFEITSGTLCYDRIQLCLINAEGQLKLYRDKFSCKQNSITEEELRYHEDLWQFLLNEFKANHIVLRDNVSLHSDFQDFIRKIPNDPTISFSGTPIFIGQEFFGVLIISFARNYHFRSTDEQLLRFMSNTIALAEMRRRNRDALKHTEKMNQLILDHVGIPLLLYTPNGKIIQVNQEAFDFFRIKKLVSQPYTCADFTNCLKTNNECLVQLAFNDGQDHHEIITDGFGRDLFVDARPVSDENGHIINVVKSVMDVTKINRMSQNRQIINECLYEVSRENDMNRAIELTLGRIRQHLKTSRCYIFSFDTTKKTFSCLFESVEEGSPFWFQRIVDQPCPMTLNEIELCQNKTLREIPDFQLFFSKNEHNEWAELFQEKHIRSLYSLRIMLDDQCWGCMGFIYEKEPHLLLDDERDFLIESVRCIELMLIRKRYQNQIIASMEQARAADNAKSMFLASMSHEIRTPLNSIIGFSELLKDNALPEKVRNEYLDGICISGNALLALINDVLDLSRLEANRMEFTLVKTSFRSLLEETVNVFSLKCDAKGVLLITEIADDFPLLYVDTLRIRQLLFNLVGNAAKFTQQGSITIRICFHPETKEDGTLTMDVIDTGIGISPEDQKILFQMFVQSSAMRGTKVANSGTGLGLAICRRMVEKMNGKISLTSEKGKGSDFKVVLQKVQFLKNTENGEQRTPAAEKKDHEEIPVLLTSLSVLIVDDVEMNLKIGEAMLNKLGAKTTVAKNVHEAWTLLETKHFDVLFTDLWMPDMKGNDFAAKIRDSKRWPKLKIAALTADTENNKSGDMSIFDIVLIKPITSNMLYQFLSQFCDKSEL